MKNRFTPSVLASLLLVVALALPGFVFAQQTRADRTGNDPATARGAARGAATTAAVERDVSEALTLIEDNYVDGANLNYNETVKSSILGMLRTLDPHSNYYDRREFEELRNDQRSEYYGIGASINNWTIDGHTDTHIMATFEGSPAQRAGLRYGDRIAQVDGQDMRGKTSAEVRDRIRGPRGSEVRLMIERAATGRTEPVVITRDAVGQPSIPDFYMIRPGVGFIDMSRGFNTTTSNELEQALTTLRGQGMTSLVLDLRNNPGGFLDQAVRVASRFLQRGQVILTQRGRNPANTDCSRNAERAENGDCVHRARFESSDTTPITVLINRGSASASEIVAGALQDHDRGLIVGETSFGKGLVQSIFFLEYGAGLTLTSAKYYTPSGRLIQRDYSNGSLYDYYMSGASRDGDTGNTQGQTTTTPARPTGPESRTDAGRVVYSGGGIAPDETVRPRLLVPAEARLLDSLFAFTREVVNGRISGFDAYRVPGGIDYRRELQATDFPVTDALVAAYKRFVASRSSFGVTEAQIDRHRDFVARRMRYDIASAAYGTTMAQRVFNNDDPQILRSLEVQPRARELAAAVSRGREQRSF